MRRKQEIERDLIRVKHIRDAAKEAKTFISGVSKKEFLSDRKLALALIKEIEIIGEAAGGVSPEFRKTHSDIPWNVLIENRNRLIHGYFDLDLDVIWDTVKNDLPKLLELLAKIDR